MTQRDLEARAVQAHRDGIPWATFWDTVQRDVAAAEPYNTDRFRKLTRRLLALCVSGDTNDVRDDDWEEDDAADDQKPSDTETRARLQWTPPRAPR